MVQPDRPQMTIRRMRIACWIIMIQTTIQNYNGYEKAPQCYFIRTVPLLLHFDTLLEPRTSCGTRTAI